MHLFWIDFGTGLATAAVVALAATGLTLQFGITNYINFAYGDFMALGALLTFALNNQALHLNFWVAAPIAAILVGVFAVIANQFLLAPFARRFSNPALTMIVTFGLSLFMANVATVIWTGNTLFYRMPISVDKKVGPFLWSPDVMIVMVFAVVVMLLIHLLLKTTRLGKMMRALSDNTSLALTSGIDVRQITNVTWFMSGLLAGLGGIALAVQEANLTVTSAESYLFVIFAAVILGGIGSVYGAMLGALAIGLLTETAPLYINAGYKLDVGFFIVIVLLLFRPQGLVPRLGRS